MDLTSGHGSGLGAMVAGAAAAYGAHNMGHGSHMTHGAPYPYGYGTHMGGHHGKFKHHGGKFKHHGGKFGKHGKFSKHGMYGGMHGHGGKFKKWK